MKRAVTINRAELKLAPAVAAEATRNGVPFNSNASRHCARLDEMQFLFTEAARGERGGPGETLRDAPSVPVRPAVGISRSQVKAI
jgi:hypothetical protein